MFCSQCGSALPDGAAFCPKCGARVIAPVEPAPEPEVAPVVEIVEEAAAPVVETVEEAAAPVVEAVEEAVAPVVEEAAEAIEDLPEAAEAAAENAVDDVEAALARLKAEMAAAGELPAEMVTPAVEEAAEAIAETAEPVAEPVAEVAEVVAEPVAEAVEPVAEAVAEVVEAVADPVAEPVAEPVVEPVAEPAPAVAPVIPIATSDEPAAYVKAASPAQTTINTIYNEPTTISAPVSPVEPAPAPAPEPVQPAYTAPVPEPVQPAYTAPAQQAYVPPAQPAYTAPQPQASYAPPAPVSQSSAGYSYQPAAAAPAAAQAKKSSPVAKIAIAAVIIALLGVGIWAIFGRGGGSNGGGSNGGGTPIVNPTADGYDMLDSKGNPTLYTIMEGNGSDIVSTIEGVGFEWEQSNIWWVSSDGNDAFYVCGPADYEYSRSEISDLDVNGEGDPCVFVIVVDDRDYASGEDAFEKLCNVEVLDTEWLDSDLGLAVVQSPSGTMDFVLVNYNDEIGLYVLSIFNEDAAQAGVVDEYIDCGSGSVAECWEEFTGRSV